MGVFIPSFGCAGFCTLSGGQGGGRSGKLPDSSLAAAHSDPDRDCNPPPPRKSTSVKLPALALGAALPTALPMGPRAAWRQGVRMQRCFPPSQIRAALQDPGSMLPNVFDLFLAGTRCKSLWRSTSANLPQFLPLVVHDPSRQERARPLQAVCQEAGSIDAAY
jgi:hypothetical protein